MYDLDEKKSEELLFQKVIKNVIRRRIEQNLPTLLTHKKSTTFESTTQDSHIDWFWKDLFIQIFYAEFNCLQIFIDKNGIE